MKKWINYLHLLLVCVGFTTLAYAQPANDACNTAIPIAVTAGTCNSILYTNVAATSVADPTTPACWSPTSLSHTVWFSFVASTADIEISTNFGGTLANTQIAVYSGTCGTLTQIACQENINTAGGLFHTDVILHGLTIGNTYYLLVDGNGNTTGTFGICAKETLPVGPTLPTQDCTGSQTLCGLGNIVVPDGPGGIGTDAEWPSCFGTPGERSSNWYSFTAATSGVLAFAITPNTLIDYDFAVYNTTASCPGNEVRCNWIMESGTGTTGLGCGGTQCENTINVVAGRTYTILVDRYTDDSASGFTMSFAGTTATFGSPNPTFTNTTTCVGTATQFTNTTSGNFTYSWSFGDGFTSTSENPTHTYATSGTYTATLLITASPGGCQNAISHSVTVTPIPTVDAGSGGTACTGNCITLGGTTNAVGGVTGPVSFSNTNDYNIPDGSAAGVYSPITVSGISPTVLAGTSIASVCINIFHDYDADLDIYLQAPDGTRIELSTDNGGLFGFDYTDTCFSPTATIPITSGTDPFTGTWLPEQSFNLLNGHNSNGTWQLFVVDDAGLDTGHIMDWAITFNNTPSAYTWSPTTAMTNSTTLAPTVCPASTTTYTLTASNGVGCTASDTVTVNVNPAPTATISYTGTPFCTSLATAQAVTLTGTGTYTGGVFTSTAGLTIDSTTGAITPGTSTPNTYTITYTIAASAGCPAVVTTTSITIKLLPTAIISYAGTPFCSSLATGQAVTLTGTGTYTGGVYSSTAGLTINSATGAITPSTSSPNSYTVTYTIAANGGCAAVVATTSVTINTLPTATISYTGTPFCSSLATSQAVTLAGTGAYTGGLYTSTAGLSINSATGAITPNTSTPNTYTVTYTIAASGGCAAVVATASISINALPTATISYAGTPFCSSIAASQAVTLTGTGSYTGGLYSSTAGLTINNVTGAITPSTSTPNTYTVSYTIAASGGCTAVVATTSVTISPNLTPTINCGASTTTSVEFTWAAVTGATGYSVSYQVNANPVVTIGAIGNVLNYMVSPLSPGDSVSITLTPTGGAATCFTFSTATCIAANCNPPTASISYASTPFCSSLAAAQTVTLTGTGTYNGGTYSTTAGLSINTATGAINPSISTPNTYTITYTIAASGGCPAVTATTSVTITPLPTASISYAGTPFCSSIAAAQAVTLTGTGAYTGGVYSSTAGLSINSITGAITPSTSTPNTYTVTYTIGASAGCALVTTTTSVTINVLPTATISYVGTPFCSSLAAAQAVTLIGTGAYTGGVYTSTAGLSINSGTGDITPNTSTPNTYTVTYTIPANGGCSAVVATTSVTITPLPTAIISYAGTPFCSSIVAAQAVTLNGTGAYTGGVYSSTAGLSINSATGAIIPSTSTPNTYTVTYTITAVSGCAAVVATTSITITPLPTASISYAGTPFCSSLATGQNVTLTGTGAYTGGVYSSTPGLTINAATGAITPNTSTPNTYTVIYTIAASAGCAAVTATTSVTITPLPTATISYTGTPFCSSIATAQAVTLTGTGAYTGGVYSSTAGLSINSVTGAITPSSSTPNTYTVTYTIAASSGCAAVVATTSITINVLPTAAISYAGNPFCTSLAAAQAVTLTGTGAYTGGVYSSSVGLTINAATGAITPSTSTPNTYTVSYTIAPSAGCAVVVATASITITQLPTAIISYSTPFCSSQTIAQAVTLTGTGAYTGGVYSSTAGLTINAATGDITPNTSTPNTCTITYTIAASAGCAAVITTTSITITLLPTATISYAGTPFCSSLATAQAVTLTGTGAYTGGVYSSTAGLSINSATGVITPSTSIPNTYTVTYTIVAGAGCATVVATTSVTITPLPTATISYAGTPFCSSLATGQTGTLTGTGAYTGGVYSSTAGLTINAVTGAITPSTSTPNTYTVSYTIAANGGCAAVIATTSVTITALPTASISYGTPFCSSTAVGQAVTLTGTGTYTGGVYTAPAGLTINATTGAIIPSTSTPNTYIVTYTITGSPGCANVIATTSVTITPLPTATISYAGTPFCSSLITGQAVTLTGTGAYTGGVYSSTAGLSINAVTGAITPSTSTPNTYTVTYTIPTNAGCTAVVATTSVTISPILTPTINCGLSSTTSVQFIWATVTGATGYSVSYQVNANPVVNIGAVGNVLSYSVNSLTPGDSVTITLTPTGGAATCFAFGTATCIAVNCNPPTASISYGTPFCSSTAVGQAVTLTGTGTYTGGVYTAPAGLTINATTGAIIPSTSTPNTYIVTYTITGSPGCANVIATTSVTITALPSATISYAGTPFCSSLITGQAVTLSGTGAYTGGVYSSTAGLTINAATGDITPNTSTPNTYTVSYTIAANGGCAAVVTTTSITITPLPTATISYAGTPFCSSLITGQAVTLTGTGAYTGGVYSSTAGLTINASTGAITPNTSTPNAYTITYTIAASAGCAAVIATTSITITPLPTATISYAGTPFCSSLATGQTVTLTGTGAYTGGVYSSTAGLIINAATGAITPSTSTPNTYTVTYTIAANGGCAAVIATTSVTITALPSATISYTGTPFCSSLITGQAVTLSGTGAYTGGVYSSTAGSSINAATGAINPSASTPNTYTVTYTIAASGGCAAVVATTSVLILPTLTSTFPIVNPICSGTTLSPLPTTSNEGVIGIWSPALDNTTTTTYTFTPSAGQCATNGSLTIVVYSLPQITYVNPLYYCDPNNDHFGNFELTQIIPSLTGGIPYPVSFHETFVDAQIHGTTIPNPSNYFTINPNTQTIYIRIDSPASSACYEIVTLQLFVNPTPEATEPLDYHVCDDNTDGFANFNLTTVVPEVLGTSINPATHTVSYYHNLNNAETKTGAISNFANYTNLIVTTETIWIRVENNTTGCYDIVTLQLIVDPLPFALQPSYQVYNLCDSTLPLAYEEFDLGSKIGYILQGQTGMNVTFHFSQADAQSDANPLPLLYTNGAPYVQTIWIRIENAITGCFVLSTMDIRVQPMPSPIPPINPYTVCDDNQDGFSTFNLNSLTSDILQGANYTITYHEKPEDAQAGSNPLVSPYENVTPFMQIIYAAAVDNNTGCRSVIPIELRVEPKPLTPITIPPLVQCDQDNNPQNQSMLFDLTQIDAVVLAAQTSATANFTVTYYVSQTDAIVGTHPIIQSTNYVGNNHQIIWVRVENNASHCFAIGSFQLLVNPPLALIPPTPLNICDSDAHPNDQFTEFDLTVKNNEITQGLPGMTVTYYPSFANAQSGTNPIANPTAYTNIIAAVQPIGVLVTSPQGCKSYTILDIRVLPIPTPNTRGLNPLPAQCDSNNTGDMLETFNLTLNASLIINGDPTLTLHYYPEYNDAVNGTREILNPSNALVGHNVWIRVENNRVDYLGHNCFALVEQPLKVNPLPATITPSTVQNCDDDRDGQVSFNLTTTASTFYGDANFTITYYTSASNAQLATNPIANPSAYLNTSNPQIIYIRVVNNVTGCVNYNGQFTIVVNPKPTGTTPTDFQHCDDDGTNDGFYTLDLSSYINAVIGSQTGVTTTFYNNQTDAANETNGISDLVNYQAYTHTVWIRVENNTTGCSLLVPFKISIEKLAVPNITSPGTNICVEYGTNVLLSGLTLDSGITNPNYTFEWSLAGTVILGATGSTYTITSDAAGDYTVIATSVSPLQGCASDASNPAFTVLQSGPPQFLQPPYTVSNAFDDNQIITVNVVGLGTYEYSLDEGPYQSSNVFEHVTLDTHSITVRDAEGNTSCGQISIEDIQTISYPHYFTPNGDGFNDTWNVHGLENQNTARLYIFDRFGKLLKQLSTTSSSSGWDGTYNGYILPADDYWFKVEYFEQAKLKEFKAHFTLKR